MRCEKSGMWCSGYHGDSQAKCAQHAPTRQTVELSRRCQAAPLIDLPDSTRTSTLMTSYISQSWASMVGSSRRQPPYGWILSLSDVHRTNSASNLALNALT